jgi:hypothetical protein
VAQEIEGRPVGPVDVVDEHRRRAGAGGFDHEPGHREHLPGVLAVAGFPLGNIVEVQVAERAHALEERDVPLASGLRRELPGERGEQRFPERQVREIEVFVAAAPYDGDSRRACADEELLHEARLADPGIALDEDEVPVPAGREIEAGPQPAELPPSADEVGGRVARVTVRRGGHPGTLIPGSASILRRCVRARRVGDPVVAR